MKKTSVLSFASTRMNALERSLLRWSIVDEEDEVLDLGHCSAAFHRRLQQLYHPHLHSLSEWQFFENNVMLQSEDASVYLPSQRDIRLNAVLGTLSDPGLFSHALLQELLRLLIPGGHFIIAFRSFPLSIVRKKAGFFLQAHCSADKNTVHMLENNLRSAGYRDVQTQHTGLFHKVIMGWKGPQY